jgi:photosystem II stability/assembly factor-like uncharacterized protein
MPARDGSAENIAIRVFTTDERTGAPAAGVVRMVAADGWPLTTEKEVSPMRRSLLAAACLSIFASIALAQSSIDRHPGENLYAYRVRMEAYFAPRIAQRGEGALIAQEGGEYNEYLKFMRDWEPRLAPHGDFMRYWRLEYAWYHGDDHGPRRRVVRHATSEGGVVVPNLVPWHELGPTSKPPGGDAGIGPVEFILFFPPAPERMVCGSTAGGLFVSKNGGATWSKTGTDTQIDNSGIISAALHPTDFRIWYAASSGRSNKNYALGIGLIGGIFRTTDEGITWTKIATAAQLGGAETKIYKLLVDPLQGGRLLAATSSGLYATDDALVIGGVTWKALLPNAAVYDVEFRPGNTSRIYATVGDGSAWRFKVSQDGGANWQDIAGMPSTAGAESLSIEVTPMRPDSLYGVIRRSAGDCVYNFGYSDGVSQLFVADLVTHDVTIVTDKACLAFGEGFAVDPFDPNTIFLSHDGEGRRYTVTPSSVRNWDSHYHGGQFHADVESVDPHPRNANEIWMSHHGGVSVSKDGGTTWTDRSTGLGVAQPFGMSAAESDEGVVAMGLYHDGTVLTSPPWSEGWTPSWNQINGGDGLRPLVGVTRPQYVWSCRVGNFWDRTTDGGKSSEPNGPLSPWWSRNTDAAFNRVSPATHFRIASDHTIHRTPDWGDNWPDEPISDFAKFFPSTTHESFSVNGLYTPRTDGDTLLATLAAKEKDQPEADHLFRTKKANAPAAIAAESWEELTESANPYIGDIEFDPDDSNVVYIANQSSGGSGRNLVIRADYTDPKNPAFTDLTQNLPDVAAGVAGLALTLDGTRGLYYVTDAGVFYSSSFTRASGEGWSLVGTQLPHTNFNGIDINDRNHKMRVASHGRGLWEHDLVSTISGIAFHDADHDGVRDAGEPPLSGWAVLLSMPNGATLTATTDANGGYSFSALAAGRYEVFETPVAGWAETLPSAGRYVVQLTAGAWAKDLDFGNDTTARTTCATTTASLAAWWTFDDAANAATAHDAAGIDNAGTRVAAPQTVPGKVAGALRFNGNTQYVEVPSHPEVDVDTGDFSIHAWLRTTTVNTIFPIVDKRLLAASSNRGYSFFLYNSLLGLQMADRSGSTGCSSSPAAPCTNWFAPPARVRDGQWHHVAVSVDRDSATGGVFYVDGQPVYRFNPTLRNRSLLNAAPLWIGATNYLEDIADGDLDEVVLVKSALSSYDIASIYAAGAIGQCRCQSNCVTTVLSGGKIVFSSDRVKPAQLFVKDVDSSTPPRQLTSDFYGARHPHWSPDGKYVAYVRRDVITGPASPYDDELTVIDDTANAGQWASIHADRFAATDLGYPQWSRDGKSIVVLYWADFGARGIGIIDSVLTNPTVRTLVAPSATLNPGEPIFSADGKVYFSADAPGMPAAALYVVAATGGTPVPVRDAYGVQVRRFFAPSLSPNSTRLLFNSEMWREDPNVYQDEEVLELELATGVLRRITAEPRNQYAWYAINGSGEFLLLSNDNPNLTYQLFLQRDATRIAIDLGDPQDRWNETGDWWKSP